MSFKLPNPSTRNMTLGSTRPLTEMSTRKIPGVKGGRRVRPTVSRLSRRCGSLDLSHLYGPSRPVTGTTLHFYHELSVHSTIIQTFKSNSFRLACHFNTGQRANIILDRTCARFTNQRLVIFILYPQMQIRHFSVSVFIIIVFCVTLE
jgi:hypothetical protein